MYNYSTPFIPIVFNLRAVLSLNVRNHLTLTLSSRRGKKPLYKPSPIFKDMDGASVFPLPVGEDLGEG
jgi:hypothetical protein